MCHMFCQYFSSRDLIRAVSWTSMSRGPNETHEASRRTCVCEREREPLPTPHCHNNLIAADCHSKKSSPDIRIRPKWNHPTNLYPNSNPNISRQSKLSCSNHIQTSAASAHLSVAHQLSESPKLPFGSSQSLRLQWSRPDGCRSARTGWRLKFRGNHRKTPVFSGKKM